MPEDSLLNEPMVFCEVLPDGRLRLDSDVGYTAQQLRVLEERFKANEYFRRTGDPIRLVQVGLAPPNAEGGSWSGPGT